MAGRSDNQSHPFEDESHRRPSPDLSVRKRRRWPWLLLILLLAGVFFLPNVIAITGLKQQAIDYALTDFQGRVTVRSASLGWLQPITLQKVEAVDAAGQPLVTIDEIKTSRSLISFLSSSDYGSVEINQPSVWVQLRPDGSNFEDACAAWMTPSDNELQPASETVAHESTRLPKMQLNVNNGTIAVFSTDQTRSWQIERLNVTANTSHELAAVVSETACQVTVYDGPVGSQPTAQTSGIVSASVQVDPGSPVLSGNSIEAQVSTNNLPLSIAGPIMQRFTGPTETNGSLTANLQAAIDLATGSIGVAIQQADVANLTVVAPDMIGSDELRIANLMATGNLSMDPSLVKADQFQVVSDFAKASADGTLDLRHVAGLTSADASIENVKLLDTPFQLTGELDLAGVAASFPATLHLHDGLKIESGSVNLQAASRVENEVRRLIVNVDTANLVARDQEKPIVWQKPLRLVGTVRESNSGLMLEEVLCESDFLTVSGTANHETGSFAAEGDLAQLLQRVGQFVDVGQTMLAGKLDGKLAWQTNQPDQTSQGRPVQLVGEFNIAQPKFQLPGMSAWQRPKLTSRMSAAGYAMPDQSIRMDQAGIQLDIGTEQLIATLAEPVENALAQSTWKLATQLSGSADGWLAHAKNFVDLGDIQADGTIQARAVTYVNPDAIEIQGAEYELQQFQFDGYGLTIREQQTTGTASARYDLNSSQLLIAETTLSSSSISLGGQQIAVDLADNLQINGDLAFRANVNRIADWLQLSPTKDSVFWFGDGEGTIRFISDSAGIGAVIAANVNDMIAATRQSNAITETDRFAANPGSGIQTVSSSNSWMELWREAKVNLGSQVKMSNDFDTIAFAETSLESNTIQAKVSGQISDLSAAMMTDIQGTWSPDWKKLNSLLAAYTGQLVQMTGQGEHPISVRGPLFEPSHSGMPDAQSTPWVSPLLSAATEFGWQQATVAGVPVGAGRVGLDLQQAIANVSTNAISFSGGTLQLQPQIDLRNSAPVLYLPEGKLIDQIALTPETARGLLAYVAPLAADATSAQGTFSLATKGAQVPLMDPMQLQAEGELTLSNVVIGAGPASAQLIATATQLRTMLDPESANSERDLTTWLTLEEQTVPVAVRNGRVFHEGVKISHKDIIVKTRGSVGLDQSLDLVAEIPIADDWIDGKPHFASLKGQMISVPVTGTTSAPRLDTSAIKQISSQLVKEAASGAINKILGEKIAPKVTEYQNQINSRVSAEATKLQNKIQSKLMNKLAPAAADQLQESAKDNLKNELLKGFGNLLGK